MWLIKYYLVLFNCKLKIMAKCDWCGSVFEEYSKGTLAYFGSSASQNRQRDRDRQFEELNRTAV